MLPQQQRHLLAVDKRIFKKWEERALQILTRAFAFALF